MCDVSEEDMADTARLCESEAPEGTRISTHRCDVSIEEQVEAFRDAVTAAHETDHVNLLFNNAGIGGGGTFVDGNRDEWEKTFAVCWSGVYLCSRAFMPLLVASEEAVIVNTSSINGFWASVGPDTPHTAYSAAKFAVKGFTEALITDLRLNAPHVRAAVVMPGHIGTSIAINSRKILGPVDPTLVRKRMAERGLPVDQMSDDDLLAIIDQMALGFRDNAPTTAAQAAAIILDGVRAGRWRILVGDDAFAIDEMVRSDPEAAYDVDFIDRIRAAGHFRTFMTLEPRDEATAE
jgi:NAD(P)-dependent dehydrogenase (short-subunit alcohol dehydrogenase family)